MWAREIMEPWGWELGCSDPFPQVQKDMGRSNYHTPEAERAGWSKFTEMSFDMN